MSSAFPLGSTGRLEGSRDRVMSGLAVVALHILLLGLFLFGLDASRPPVAADALKIFDVPPPPAPPPIWPVSRPAEAAPAAAAPPALRASPAAPVAPPQAIRLPVPPPLAAAPVTDAASDPSAGASDVRGPGAGADGAGSGSGGGGTGAGGGVSRPRLLTGAITRADYPRSAWNSGGSVVVRFTVDADGRPRGCTILESSGHADLAITTCHLIEARFRYAPARDRDGRARPAPMGWRQDWWLAPRR